MKGSSQYICAALLTAALSGCSESPYGPTPKPRVTSAVSRQTILARPVADAAMGDLSAVARQVVVGLQDSATRAEVLATMRQTNGRAAALRLDNCGTASVGARLLAAGQRFGADSASAICRLIQVQHGLKLYMNAMALDGWRVGVIPPVTAIAHPERHLPDTILAYRSASRMIAISVARKPVTFLLVVLPYVDASALSRAEHPQMSQHTVVADSITIPPGLRGPPPAAPLR